MSRRSPRDPTLASRRAEQGGRPGRSCPISYRYGPEALRHCAEIEADTLYVAGGLYGNSFALDTLLNLVARDPGARLVFNGDFNWFDDRLCNGPTYTIEQVIRPASCVRGTNLTV